MAKTELERLRAALARLLTARDRDDHAATRNAFNNLIRSIRAKIRRLEKRDECKSSNCKQ